MTEIPACLQCGGPSQLVEEEGRYKVVCHACGMNTAWQNYPMAAVTVWANTAGAAKRTERSVVAQTANPTTAKRGK